VVTVGIQHREYSVVNKNGLSLYYQSWNSDTGAPTKAAHIVHGLGDHTGCYEELAHFLVSRDFKVYGLDLHGFGKSEGKRGHVIRIADHISDLKLLHTIMQQKNDLSQNNLIYGQSFGGLLALAYLQKYPDDYTHAIISAPALNPAQNVNRLLLFLSRVCNSVLPSLPFKNRIKSEQITEDTDAQDAYRDDPYVHQKITPRLFTEMLRLSKSVRENIRHFKKDLHILFIHGEADEVTNHRDTLSLYEQIPVISKRMEIVPGMKHDPLTYREGEMVYGLLSDWFGSVGM